VDFRSLDGRTACERLARLGVLAKDTHGSTIRLGPPLTISEPDLDWAADRLAEAIR
jgi:ornithine--oxo-acid transaminase